MTIRKEDRIYKGATILLFTFLTAYLAIRVFTTETLHDEVATYIFFFYHGDYIGEHIQWDANNHLLNSFIGHQLYKVFGDNFAILRLPNFLAFILYFWGCNAFLKGVKRQSLRFIGLLALTTIPYTLEYFGYARGYGLSMGFLIWALVYLNKYIGTLKVRSLALTYLFALLSVSSNLTLISVSGIIAGIAIYVALFSTEEKPKTSTAGQWFFHILFFLALLPFVYFALALKKGGALYYGSLEGLWDVTGKSLSRYVLFMDSDYLMFPIAVLLLVFLFYWVSLIIKRKWNDLFSSELDILSVLLFGSLIGSTLLAIILKVNYPEDRAAMYLIPVFILLFIYILDQIKVGSWLQFSLLFFPVTLITHLSIETSVFSPDDRMNEAFYLQVKKHIKPEHSIMIDPIMNWNWPYQESHQDVKASVAQFNNINTILNDILVVKTTKLTNIEIPKLYDTIALHDPSDYIAFIRKLPTKKTATDTIYTDPYSGQNEFVDLATFDSEDLCKGHNEVRVEGHIKSYDDKNKILLIVQSAAEDGTGHYLYYDFGTCFQGQKIDDSFRHNFVLEDIYPHEKQIKVYLWNRGSHHVELKDVRCILSEIKE